MHVRLSQVQNDDYYKLFILESENVKSVLAILKFSQFTPLQILMHVLMTDWVSILSKLATILIYLIPHFGFEMDLQENEFEIYVHRKPLVSSMKGMFLILYKALKNRKSIACCR